MGKIIFCHEHDICLKDFTQTNYSKFIYFHGKPYTEVKVEFKVFQGCQDSYHEFFLCGTPEKFISS